MERFSRNQDGVASNSINRLRLAFCLSIDFRKPLPAGLLDRHAAGWYTKQETCTSGPGFGRSSRSNAYNQTRENGESSQ